MDQDYKKHILEVVSSGVKNVDLALKVMERINPVVFDANKFAEVLLELITSGKIIEIEYILPHMDYVIKSFYLPARTKIYPYQ